MAGKKMVLDEITNDEVDTEIEDEDVCPNCGGEIVRIQGCKQCKQCGTRLC